MDVFDELFGRPPADDAGDIKKLIDKCGRTEEIEPPMGQGDRIRASRIGDFCPRFEAMRHRDKIDLKKKVDGRLNRIFKHGRIFERALRDFIFGPPGLLIGQWRCGACNELTTKECAERPFTCLKCSKTDTMTYEEPFGMIPGTNIGGSADGFLIWKDERCLLEVKTAKDEFWREVARTKAPMPHHVSQAQVYLEAFGCRRSLIWYYNKNTSEHLPVWIVKSEAHVKKLVAKDAALKDYFNTGNIPERICDSQACSRAKQCSLKAQCFGS